MFLGAVRTAARGLRVPHNPRVIGGHRRQRNVHSLLAVQASPSSSAFSSCFSSSASSPSPSVSSSPFLYSSLPRQRHSNLLSQVLSASFSTSVSRAGLVPPFRAASPRPPLARSFATGQRQQQQQQQQQQRLGPYDVLGVSRGGSDKEYKLAYLKKAKEYHPDLHPEDPEATARFQEISAAYEQIKTADARAATAQNAHASAYSDTNNGYASTGEAEEAAAKTWDEASTDAEAMMEAANDWLSEEADELEEDVEAAARALQLRNWDDLLKIADKRKFLVLGGTLKPNE